MQSDGNLVEYNSSGTALWASDTSGQPGNYLLMQSDGNLVVYSSSGQARWATDPFTQITWGEQYIAGTYGNPENAWNHEVEYGWYATPKLS